MTTVTVQAVYADGVLKPVRKLDLPEGASVEVEIKAVQTRESPAPPSFASLAGIWSHLTTEQVEQLGKDIYALRQREAERVKQMGRDLHDPRSEP